MDTVEKMYALPNWGKETNIHGSKKYKNHNHKYLLILELKNNMLWHEQLGSSNLVFINSCKHAMLKPHKFKS